MIAFSDRIDEFEKLNTQVLGVSVDSHFSHYAWRQVPRSEGGIGDIRYPLVSDLSKKIAEAYDVLLDGGIALRGLFLIDKEGIVRHESINDLPLGRNIDEAIRIIQALQHFEQHGEVCPANWKPGSQAMKASIDGSKEYFKSQYGG